MQTISASVPSRLQALCRLASSGISCAPGHATITRSISWHASPNPHEAPTRPQVPSSRVHQAQGGTPSELKRLADLEAKFAHLTAKPTQQHTATYQQSLDRALHEVGRNHPEVQDAFKQGYKQAGYVPWRPGWKKAFDTCFTMFVYMLLPLVALCSIGVLFLTVMFFVWLFSRMG